MSQRSIIEINHDMSHIIKADNAQTFAMLLGRALASGSNESWEPLQRFGITRIIQCHHSDDRKVTIGTQEYQFG